MPAGIRPSREAREKFGAPLRFFDEEIEDDGHQENQALYGAHPGPGRPVATRPASSIQMMQQPKKVPTIVARPPKIEVPPINTAAIAVSR